MWNILRILITALGQSQDSRNIQLPWRLLPEEYSTTLGTGFVINPSAAFELIN